MNKKTFYFSLFSAALLFGACSKDDDDNTDIVDPNASLKQSAIANYSNIVHASYEDSYNAALDLQTKINSFVATPNQTLFDAAKKSWLDSREPYGQTEAYRFYSGPIDDENGPEGNINAWPLDESHVDYVQTGTGNDENSGAEKNIINNLTDYPTIDVTTLSGENENGGEKNISLGFHAIEFLLWGQDFDANGPGNRTFTDFVTDGSGTNDNQQRRGEYLKISAQVLVDDLKSMVDAWAPNASNYRKAFEALPNNTALLNIFSGIGILSKSELAGERIFTALDNQDQEDEHSCFSDNTHRDIILNAQGVKNVYNGSYLRTDGQILSGTSLAEIAAAYNTTLSIELETMINQSVNLAKSIPVPFDQALTQENVGGNGPIMLTVFSLQQQGDKIAEVASAIGISISTELPE